ncbi:MAG TPA: arylsulfotransferase family protein [Thermoleophilaceae bacterium]
MGAAAVLMAEPFDHGAQSVAGHEVLVLRSRPDLRPPAVRIERRTPGAAPGSIFLAPKSGPNQAGPMIVDGDGRLVWFHPLPPHVLAYNFGVQRYRGQRVLTWWEGRVAHGRGRGQGIVADSSYRVLARVRATGGQQADLHEFQLTRRGTAFVTAFHPVRRSLAAIGGPARATVLESVIQEIDVRSGRLVFEWRSLDHVGLGESYKELPKRRGAPYDYFHLNSIHEERDGSLLISARHTNAIYEVDRRSGGVRWRIGGKRSDYRMGRGARFVAQHDARRMPDGTISLFDNGAPPDAGRESRVLVLRIDQAGRSVRLVRSSTHDEPVYSNSQGNAQPLPGGNLFASWGGRSPFFSELGRDGRPVLEARFASSRTATYRAYRFPWTGRPADRPAVAVVPAPGPGGDRLTVHASWNGATEVARWQVLAGPGPDALTPLASAARRGFETAMPVRARGRYLAVRALDRSGAALGSSRAVRRP